MDGTVRRDEGIDRVRFEEVTSELGDGLLPALRKLRGFSGCYVFESRAFEQAEDHRWSGDRARSETDSKNYSGRLS